MTNFFSGNKRVLYFGTQVAKGTPLVVPTIAFRVSDFTPNPVRARITLAESDATTQQPGDVVAGFSPGFSFKTYCRPSQFAFLFQALFGADVDSGTIPNFQHVLTPAEQTPYLTMFEREPSVWCNQHNDVRITQIQLDGQREGAIEATVLGESLGFVGGATAPTTPLAGSELPFIYPEITVTRAGVHAGTCSQFSVVFSRNGARAQGDNGFASLDYVNGLFSISGQITKYASDDADRRQVDTGSAAGTAPTSAIYEETLAIKATRDANTSINIAVAAASYPTNVAAVNTDGSPLAEVLGFRSDPQTTLAANVVVTVKDSKATPDS